MGQRAAGPPRGPEHRLEPLPVAQTLQHHVPEHVGRRRRLGPAQAPGRPRTCWRWPRPLAGLGAREGPALGRRRRERRRWHRVEGTTATAAAAAAATAGDVPGTPGLQSQGRLEERGRGSRKRAGPLGQRRRESRGRQRRWRAAERRRRRLLRRRRARAARGEEGRQGHAGHGDAQVTGVVSRVSLPGGSDVLGRATPARRVPPESLARGWSSFRLLAFGL